MPLTRLETQVLVIGAGGAGMYAAIEAARRGAQVLLLDRSLIGRGGATVMAQMTVAAAVGPDGTDHWEDHLRDTLAAGRGLVRRAPRPAALRGRCRGDPGNGSLARRLGARRRRAARGAGAGA